MSARRRTADISSGPTARVVLSVFRDSNTFRFLKCRVSNERLGGSFPGRLCLPRAPMQQWEQHRCSSGPRRPPRRNRSRSCQ